MMLFASVTRTSSEQFLNTNISNIFFLPVLELATFKLTDRERRMLMAEPLFFDTASTLRNNIRTETIYARSMDYSSKFQKP